jgi:hypothetical protein
MRKITMILAAAFILQLLLPIALAAQNQSMWLEPYILAAPQKGHYYASAIGDINNDGLDDLVVNLADYDDLIKEYAIMVYLQDNNGRMENYVKYQLPSTAYKSVSIGDVNSDGLKDVVVSSYEGIAIFFQNDQGTLDAAVTISGEGTFKVMVVDIDGDNDDDVVALHTAAAYDVSVHLQVGGLLQAPTTYSLLNEDYKDIRIGDFNGDSRKDIVVVRDAGVLATIIGILHQSSVTPGTFDAAVYHSSTFVIGSCDVGDVTNDGRDDLLVTSNDAGVLRGISVYPQNVGGTLDAPVLYNIGTPSNNPLAVFDMNDDGLKDVIISSNFYCFLLFQEIGSGTFNVANMEQVDNANAVALDTQTISYGDLNNDNRTDMVIANYKYGAVIYYGSDNSNKMSARTVNGGYFDAGSTLRVKFAANPTINLVDIYISKDYGTSWETIASNINYIDGFYDWTTNFTHISDNLIFRVGNSQGGVEATSKIPIKIEDDGSEGLILTAPDGGETLVAGTDFDITWLSTASVGNMLIEYSTNSGTDWATVVDSTDNDGSYTWTVPDENSATCLIRISEVQDGFPTDTSDAVFTILPAGSDSLNLTSPNGGEGLTSGAVHNITWTSTGSISNVQLHYSLDNGSSWNLINTVPNSGTYAWTVPFSSSSQCLVRVRDSQDNTPSDVSNSVFSIGAFGEETITVTTPNGGESFFIGTAHLIEWNGTGPVANVKIEYSINNGSSWNTIINSTTNTGSYSWQVPDSESDQCLVRVSDASDGTPTDTSNAVFSIKPITPALFIKTPKGGEFWSVGKKHDITWNTYGNVGNVKIQYSTDDQATWKTITSNTANDGSYTWTIPNTPSSKCFVKISEASDGVPYTINSKKFSIITGNETPAISIDRQSLNFSAVKSSPSQTGEQYVIVKNGGAGVLKWNAEKVAKNLGDNINWLRLSNYSGIQSGKMEVSIDPFGFSSGTYSASIKLTADGADNSPVYINVTMNVKAAGTDALPFGSFDTPVNGETVMSSIPVTGWVLDDIEIDEVTIWRSPVSGEGKGLIYIGDALLVDGARPDVELAYPTYPLGYKAGWGYMLLTNALPNGGNGTFTLHAYAKDVGKHEFLLGSKTIVCDNAHAVKPFGAIDSPAPGGIASGSSYRNEGWVLTPMPNSIPVDGSTLQAFVDGQYIGQPNYNVYRHDIAAFFPGYANSNGAKAYLDFDTTEYDDGLHTIQWTATDTGGNTDGIGSRFFTVLNSGYRNSSGTNAATPQTAAAPASTLKKFVPSYGGKYSSRHRFTEIEALPLSSSKSVKMKVGYGSSATEKSVHRSNSDKPQMNKNQKAFSLSVPLNQRLSLYPLQPGERLHAGYLLVGESLRRLPIGSSIDYHRGAFYWQVCPGHLGTFELVFIVEDKSGKITRRHVNVRVDPGFEIKNVR